MSTARYHSALFMRYWRSNPGLQACQSPYKLSYRPSPCDLAFSTLFILVLYSSSPLTSGFSRTWLHIASWVLCLSCVFAFSLCLIKFFFSISFLCILYGIILYFLDKLNAVPFARIILVYSAVIALYHKYLFSGIPTNCELPEIQIFCLICFCLFSTYLKVGHIVGG